MSIFAGDTNTTASSAPSERPMFSAVSHDPRGSRRLKIIAGTVAGFAAFILVIAAAGGYIYWRSFYNTPEYSLALLIEAAQRDDKQGVDDIVDVDSVVDDFVPQIAAKAAELYGRGIPPSIIEKLAVVAAPLVPSIKERARSELPRVIRERTVRFADVPFPALVIGAGRYLDIKTDGDTAVVKTRRDDQAPTFKMRRLGGKWRIVSIRDDKLATDIARTVGQELIAIAKNGAGVSNGSVNIGGLADILREAEKLIK